MKKYKTEKIDNSRRQDKIVRMTLDSYLRLRIKFPAYENESVTSYFERLSIKMDLRDY